VAKHAAKHRKRKNRTHGAAKARAVAMAGLTAGGLVLAPHPHSASSGVPTAREDVLLTAGSIVFIDGNNYPNGSTRMAGQLQGQYQYQPCTAPCTHLTAPAPPPATNYYFINNTAVYPGTLGLYNGLGAPTGDQSIAAGQQALDNQIKTSPAPVTVVGYSEGAVAASHEVSSLGPSTTVSFVLIANPERPNGGILARMPAGTYIPLLGITGGNATSSSGAPVVMVTQQYDGVADAPAYPLNVVSDTNAILGFYYLHGNYYPVNPNAPGNIVTTSPNGSMTDILVPAAPGKLPLFMPLAQAGVPQPILVALDPAARAIIETGYARSSDPSQQVRFALLPPISAWPGDAQAIVVGVITTVQLLPGALVMSVPGAPALVVVAPLKTTSPVSSLSPVNSSPVNTSVSQVQPASQVQPNGVTNPTVNAGTNVGQQTTPTITTSSSNASPPGPGASQTASTRTTKPNTLDMTAGNKVTPTPTNTGGATSSNRSNPLQAALTSVTNAIGSLTGTSPKSTSTGSTSSQG
jgi:hypothetical protein